MTRFSVLIVGVRLSRKAKQLRRGGTPGCGKSDAYPRRSGTGLRMGEALRRACFARYLPARIMRLDTKIVRFHNVYGPLGTYEGGQREGSRRREPESGAGR